MSLDFTDAAAKRRPRELPLTGFFLTHFFVTLAAVLIGGTVLFFCFREYVRVTPSAIFGPPPGATEEQIKHFNDAVNNPFPRPPASTSPHRP